MKFYLNSYTFVIFYIFLPLTVVAGLLYLYIHERGIFLGQGGWLLLVPIFVFYFLSWKRLLFFIMRKPILSITEAGVFYDYKKELLKWESISAIEYDDKYIRIPAYNLWISFHQKNKRYKIDVTGTEISNRNALNSINNYIKNFTDLKVK